MSLKVLKYLLQCGKPNAIILSTHYLGFILHRPSHRGMQAKPQLEYCWLLPHYGPYDWVPKGMVSDELKKIRPRIKEQL